MPPPRRLRGLTFGNGGNGGNPGIRSFAAGIEDELHGLFGSIQAVPEPASAALLGVGMLDVGEPRDQAGDGAGHAVGTPACRHVADVPRGLRSPAPACRRARRDTRPVVYPVGRLTGNYVPRIFQFALPMEPHAYDPAKAKKLLAEAGYPNGFDAGDLYPFPPYNSMGESILGYLQAVGIKSRMRTMERAAYFTAWREKKLHGLIVVITAAFGNAATRLEPYATKNGVYAYGSLPEIDDLYARQARELDVKKREAMVHDMQKTIREKVTAIPLFEQAFIWGVGPRVEDAGDGRIPGFSYSAPFEDLRLKK